MEIFEDPDWNKIIGAAILTNLKEGGPLPLPAGPGLLPLWRHHLRLRLPVALLRVVIVAAAAKASLQFPRFPLRPFALHEIQNRYLTRAPRGNMHWQR